MDRSMDCGWSEHFKEPFLFQGVKFNRIKKGPLLKKN